MTIFDDTRCIFQTRRVHIEPGLVRIMKSKLNWSLILLIAVLAIPMGTSAQEDAEPKALPEGTIRFDNFNDQPWKEIIEEYARQAGLELTMIEPPPISTFQFQGSQNMTYLEALDFLNENLIPRERILVRKRHILYLFDMSKGIPEAMIQTVAPEDLDERGKYEILKCNFDVKGLDAINLRNQIEPLVDDVHRRRMAVVDLAHLIVIQETAGQLRFIRDKIINVAMENVDNWDAVYIKLEHAIPEDVIDACVQNLGLNRDTRRTEDGSLSISIHPHGDKILATGEPPTINRLRKLILALDQDFDDPDAERIESYYASYRVDGNVELIHEVLQSMMSGRDINLDFDETTNRIHLRGRPADHEDVLEVIEKTGRGSENFSVFRLNVMDAEEAKEKIEEAFGLGMDDAADAPTITELPQERLVIRGNPAMVSEIVQMLSQIDVPFQREPGTRTEERRISMSASEVDRTMQMLSDIAPSLRLNNQIEVVMPGEQSWKFNRNNRAFEIHRGEEIMREAEERQRTLYGNEPESGDGDSTPSEIKRDDSTKENDRPEESTKKDTVLFLPPTVIRLKNATPIRISKQTRNNVFQTVSTRQQEQPQQEEHQNGSGLSSNEQDEVDSVPGAPITLYVSDRGITIHTKDLDAGDLLEDLIMDELGRTSTDENMTLFLLRYREAADAKAQLEQYLGLGGGGGGGGGGMSGMMGGFMRNALPGGAGDMASALLGGGGGGSSGGSSIRELVGDVTIVADAKQYSLLISALTEDMQLIEQLIDLIDQPTAIQNPNPNGQTRLIRINYIDPEKLEEMVRANLAAVLRSSEEASGQNNRGGNAEARMQQQMMRTLLGGGGGRGGGAPEQEAPKASLSVDTRNNMLVVTGPLFIYEQINEFVQLVDRRIDRAPQVNDMVSVGDIDINLLAEILQAQDPNIEILVDETAGTSPTGSVGQRSTVPGSTSSRTNPAASNQQFMDAIRQSMRGQSGRGGDQRGRTGRGGDRSSGGRGSGR